MLLIWAWPFWDTEGIFVGAALVAARPYGSHKGCPYKAVRSGCPKRATPFFFAFCPENTGPAPNRAVNLVT